jgi:hypothetical protein
MDQFGYLQVRADQLGKVELQDQEVQPDRKAQQAQLDSLDHRVLLAILAQQDRKVFQELLQGRAELELLDLLDHQVLLDCKVLLEKTGKAELVLLVLQVMLVQPVQDLQVLLVTSGLQDLLELLVPKELQGLEQLVPLALLDLLVL